MRHLSTHNYDRATYSPARLAAIAAVKATYRARLERPFTPAIDPGTRIAPGAKVTRVTKRGHEYAYFIQNGSHSGYYDLVGVLQIRAEVYATTPPTATPPPAPGPAQFWLPAGAPHHVAELEPPKPMEDTRVKRAHEKYLAFMKQAAYDNLLISAFSPAPLPEKAAPEPEAETGLLDLIMAQEAKKRAEGHQNAHRRGKVKNSRQSQSDTRRGKKPRKIAPRAPSGGLRIRKVAA